MSRVGLLQLLLIGVLLVAAEASAREVIVGLEQSITGDSNLFSTSAGSQADGSYRIGPSINLRETRDELKYDFDYAPDYQVYMKTDGINAWNQFFRGDLTYNPSPRDELTLETRAILNRFVSTIVDQAVGAPEVSTIGLGDQGVYRVDLGYTRRFTERASGFVGATYDQLTYGNTLNVPNVSGRARLGGDYVIAPRWTAGLLAEGTYRKFDETVRGPKSNTSILNVNATLSWVAAKTVSLSGSIGPSWVRQRQDDPGAREVNLFLVQPGTTSAALFTGCGTLLVSCGVFAPASTVPTLFDTVSVNFAPGTETTSANSDFVTFFARLFVTKEWERGKLRTGYLRTQDASGGTSSTTIADTVLLTASYRPLENTVLSLYTRFTRRSTNATRSNGFPSAVPSGEFRDGGNPLNPADELASAGSLVLVEFRDRTKRREFYLTTSVTRNFTQNLSVRGEFSYVSSWNEFRQFDLSGAPLVANDGRFTRFIGRLVVMYEFDSYRF